MDLRCSSHNSSFWRSHQKCFRLCGSLILKKYHFPYLDRYVCDREGGGEYFVPSHWVTATSKAQEGQAAAFLSQFRSSRGQAEESKGHFFSGVLLPNVGARKSSKEEYVRAVFPFLSFIMWGKQFANVAFK